MSKELKKPALTVQMEVAPGDWTPSCRIAVMSTMPNARAAGASMVL